MSLDPVRAIARDRFSEVFTYLQMVSLEEPKNQAATQEIKVMRGLFFVLIYGAFEKTVNEAVQQTLVKISALQPKNCDVVHPFNVISMSRKWKSIKDTGYAKAFKQLTDFFAAVESQNFQAFDETLFSSHMQNIWANTISEILAALGATGLDFPLQQRVMIDEIVEARNAISHGREAASTIGERHQCDALRKRLESMQNFALALIAHLETFVETRSFIQAHARAAYSQPRS